MAFFKDGHRPDLCRPGVGDRPHRSHVVRRLLCFPALRKIQGEPMGPDQGVLVRTALQPKSVGQQGTFFPYLCVEKEELALFRPSGTFSSLGPSMGLSQKRKPRRPRLGKLVFIEGTDSKEKNDRICLWDRGSPIVGPKKNRSLSKSFPIFAPQ